MHIYIGWSKACLFHINEFLICWLRQFSLFVLCSSNIHCSAICFCFSFFSCRSVGQINGPHVFPSRVYFALCHRPLLLLQAAHLQCSDCKIHTWSQLIGCCELMPSREGPLYFGAWWKGFQSGSRWLGTVWDSLIFSQSERVISLTLTRRADRGLY